MDTFTSEERSAIMRKVHGKNTTPELIVRRVVHRLGYRFRLHSKNLPGKPDLVFSSRKMVIFVNGCFWHQHPGCKRGDRKPSSNTEYWHPKLEQNKQRDKENARKLKKMNWSSLVIWECQTKTPEMLVDIVKGFLG